MKIKVLILRAAGTNCDVETAYAFEVAGAIAERCYIDEVKKKNLLDYQILVLPGGFTYGDDISAGKILANEIKYTMKDKILRFLEKGNLILGICNGFQVLVKCGILPGNEGYFQPQTVSLVTNDSERFEDRWVYLKVYPERSVFTQGIERVIFLPVAHAEGKFVVKNKQILQEIKSQIVFQYVNEDGNLNGYPYNPNGSIMNIAGIADRTGRILGLMPHPERHISSLQHPLHTRLKLNKKGDGFKIFENAVNYFR
ncbi:MAG: phosphoribosylformylglycinamidine synthase I [candidate division WOR-3 bacterium]